uniref:Neurotransmitter-gated ion-channel transmembrane domain-containing protein n=1 Tax=Caenorhabditis japonica TaxID=281687 RepID=A0A8R1EE69_CAEJA
MRNEGKPPTKSTRSVKNSSARWQQNSNSKEEIQRKSKNILYCERLDNASRLIFPVVFTFYNFIYWFVYMKSALDAAP